MKDRLVIVGKKMVPWGWTFVTGGGELASWGGCGHGDSHEVRVAGGKGRGEKRTAESRGIICWEGIQRLVGLWKGRKGKKNGKGKTQRTSAVKGKGRPG